MYIPRPKGYQEPEPGEEKDSSVVVDWIQHRNGACFLVDGVDLRSTPQDLDIEAHLC